MSLRGYGGSEAAKMINNDRTRKAWSTLNVVICDPVSCMISRSAHAANAIIEASRTTVILLTGRRFINDGAEPRDLAKDDAGVDLLHLVIAEPEALDRPRRHVLDRDIGPLAAAAKLGDREASNEMLRIYNTWLAKRTSL